MEEKFKKITVYQLKSQGVHTAAKSVYITFLYFILSNAVNDRIISINTKQI